MRLIILLTSVACAVAGATIVMKKKGITTADLYEKAKDYAQRKTGPFAVEQSQARGE